MEEILLHILGELTPEQVEGLDLDARFLSDMGYPPISEIAGLDRFGLLEELSLAGQQIASWKGMPELPLLSSLILSDNELESFHHAPELPAIRELDLSLNMLNALDGMPAWDSLSSLNLGHNQIASIEQLSGRNIEQLVLSGNRRLKNLELVTSLPKLSSLYATSLSVADWSWVSDSSLEELACTPTSGHSLASLSGTALRSLRLSLQKCGSIISLQSLPGLTALSLTRIPDGVKIKLPDSPLTHLTLTHSSLRQLPDIPQGSGLVSLDLRHNLLEELPPLSSFPTLKDVYLSGNPLSKSFFSRIELHPEINWHL